MARHVQLPNKSLVQDQILANWRFLNRVHRAMTKARQSREAIFDPLLRPPSSRFNYISVVQVDYLCDHVINRGLVQTRANLSYGIHLATNRPFNEALLSSVAFANVAELTVPPLSLDSPNRFPDRLHRTTGVSST